MPKRKADSDVGDIVEDEPPTGINPYEVLDLQADASQDDVKKAYRKAALKNHPDKAAAEDKEVAHIRFQEIAFAYAILSDERRRKRYDTTGSTEESLDIDDDDFDWVDFFREQFAAAVTEERIDNFSKGYKGGDEERRHVLEAYEKVKGDVGRIYQLVMLSDPADDEERFRSIIDAAIADGEVESYNKYIKETEKSRKRRVEQAHKRRKKEAKEVEAARKEIEESKGAKKAGKKTKGDSDMGNLAALIQQRQQGRANNFFDNLEAKYAPKGKNNSKEMPDEPSEEAFAANRRVSKNGDAVEGARKSKRAKK